MFTANRVKLLGLALLLSGGTVVVTQQWLQGAVERAAQEARARAPALAPATGKRVLVANAAVPAGTILTAEHLRWQAWPAEAPVTGYLTEANTQMAKVTGAVVRTSLAAGEPLSPDRIAFPGDRSFLAAVLRPGYRAVTVNVSASTGVGGFVLPGDHVDLVLSRTLETTSATQKRVVGETVLTDVRVLGVDQRSYDGKKDVVVPSTATLEVTPKGAEVIAVVTELGKLSLALRSLAQSDTPVIEARQITRTSDSEAVGSPRVVRAAARAPAAPAAPAASPNTARIEIVRGSQSLTVGVLAERGGK